MILKTLLFRNLVDNVVKNLGLYSVGVLLLILQRAPFEGVSIVLGLVAFIIAYSSVYVINDFFDVAEDAIDEEKIKRKPLARGSVKESEAVGIYLVFLTLGLLLSICLGALFLVVIVSLLVVNLIYSAPLITRKRTGPIKLKHTLLGWPLVLMMQFLKMLLPWTTTTQLARFPILFAFGFSLLYIILFKGYKEYQTVGGSIKNEPVLTIVTIAVFLSSLLVHPEPLLQAMILAYLLVGIAFFWGSRLVDQRVLKLAPFYIILGVIILFIVMTYI
jgi:4-hydroxybenzoate polyprenyltransferase